MKKIQKIVCFMLLIVTLSSCFAYRHGYDRDHGRDHDREHHKHDERRGGY